MFYTAPSYFLSFFPDFFICRLTSIMLNFIWSCRHPKLKTMIFTRKKEDGGVSLPDFYLYHVAAIFTSITDLFNDKESKIWVSLEHQISLFPTTLIFWTVPTHRAGLGQRSFLMSSVLPFSDHLKKYQLSSRPSPLTHVLATLNSWKALIN